MDFLYDILIILYSELIKFVSYFNPKAKLWIQGRKNQQLPDLSGQKIIWMHCSSLGEFEQGRPVFEQLKKKRNDYKFVLSFFSPSGYERLKNKKEIANHILYLPIDRPAKVKEFLDFINPEIAIFVKYDFWYNFIKEINNRNIKLVFISVLLHKNQYILSVFGRFLLEVLKKSTILFTQDNDTYQLLKERGFNNVTIAGDTRIDRVIDISTSEYVDVVIERFLENSKNNIICGSTWEKDIELISSLQNDLIGKYKLIIAPHEITKVQTDMIIAKFNRSKISFYSDPGEFIQASDILIIDRIGILSRIYRYARLVYIGGGFGKGIHNTLEPASYSVPVIFGPRYSGFVEAVSLVRKKGFFSVRDHQELKKVISFLEKDKHYADAQNEIRDFFKLNRNASVKIIEYIEKLCDENPIRI